MPEVTFTGEQLYVPKAEYPDRRKFIDEFYKSFDIAASAPWNMSSLPLPPKDSVQSNLEYNDQLFVFAKYLINKIAPIILNELYRKEGYDPVSGVDYNYNGKANFLSALIPNNLEECRAISEIIDCYYKESMRNKKVESESAGSHALAMLRNACYGTLHTVMYAAYPILFASMSDPEATWKSTIEMLECISPFYDSDNSGMSGARDNPTSRTKHRGKTGGTMRRKPARDNAIFTGKPMRNGGDGPTGLVELFYSRIESYFPEITPAPIPPLNSVHPSANQIDQAFIFADYAARKILPIVLDAVKVSGARKLRNLPTIVGYDSGMGARKAIEAVSAQMFDMPDALFAAYAATHAVSTVTILDEFPDQDISEYTIDDASIEGMVATDTAIVVASAAKLNPNATWKAVREMLAELTTVGDNKSTLKRKAKPARDNATFTGEPLHDASNSLVDAFYAKIDELIPDSKPVPIPPPESVCPKHDSQQQAFIFADYAVRKFAPTALDAADLQEGADKLRKLRKIVDLETATIAVSAVRRVYYPINPSGFHTSALSHAINAVSLVIVDLEDLTDHGNEIAASSAAAAAEAANFAFYDANLNPEATWKAVNEMLAELSGVRANKSTLKRKASPKKVRNNPVEFSILRKDTKEPESFQNIDANIRRHFPDDWVDPNDLSEMERDLGAEWYYGWYEWIQVGHTFKDIVAKIKKAAGMERNNYSEGPKKGSREEYYERLVAIYNWLDRKYTLRTKHVSLR